MLLGQNFHVKVPKNKHENRLLKEGFVEDDNEDIGYLNFRLIWPISIITSCSFAFFVLAIGIMEVMPHLDDYGQKNIETINWFFTYYGRMTTTCNNTLPYEKGMYPSILRQVELKVLVNMFFRVAVCVPMAMRMFLALVTKNAYYSDYYYPNQKNRYNLFGFFNELCSVLSIMETLCLAIFALITIRFDYPIVYKYSFSLFIISTSIAMYIRTILSFITMNKESELLDKIAIVIKFLCALIFNWTASRFIYTHQEFIDNRLCHGYVHKWIAVNEYAFIFCYLLFHATLLIDIRELRFIVYPRTCSGECEPVNPENFKKNGKYEHCRSFELRQRILAGLN